MNQANHEMEFLVMSKSEWGLKRHCQGCDSIFYDMRQSPIVCPKCHTTFDEEAMSANTGAMRNGLDADEISDSEINIGKAREPLNFDADDDIGVDLLDDDMYTTNDVSDLLKENTYYET
jgi:hypothetical protein